MSVSALQRLGDSARSLDEWLNFHQYLVKILQKFRGDISVLQRAGADIVRPFRDEAGFQVFARRFRGARERVRELRLVFLNDSTSIQALARLKLENLDSGILGGEFPESLIRASASADHFGLMSTDRVLQQVDELVADVRAGQSLNRRQTQA